MPWITGTWSMTGHAGYATLYAEIDTEDNGALRQQVRHAYCGLQDGCWARAACSQMHRAACATSEGCGRAEAAAAFVGGWRSAAVLRQTPDTGAHHNSHCARRVRLCPHSPTPTARSLRTHTPQCSNGDPYARYRLNCEVSLENN
ncbi:hypothetical protein O0L34_g9663 [Tuta absoluta]|nr:hypothetical protein O0L34_g9663 [Tuta absoluta]